MRKVWLGIVTGSSLLASALIAQPVRLEEGIHPVYFSSYDRSTALVVSSPTLNQVFMNLDKTPVSSKVEQPLTLKPYKARLKKLLSVQVNNHLQVGLERVKVNAISAAQGEFIDINPQLQPKNNQPTPKGYGLELKMKF